MNWLAHILLSENSAEFRVGNVLADILSITELRTLPAPFHGGIQRHREIDSFTDKHPVFKQSVARLDPQFRRFGAVIIDVFYDHLLTAAWPAYSTIELNTFVAQFHDDVDKCREAISSDAYAIFQRMRTDRWLNSYGDTAGIRLTLRRISRRLRRPFDLASAAAELDHHYPALTADFAEFFPEIRSRFRSAESRATSL